MFIFNSITLRRQRLELFGEIEGLLDASHASSTICSTTKK
jgi:hypothetical protein